MHVGPSIHPLLPQMSISEDDTSPKGFLLHYAFIVLPSSIQQAPEKLFFLLLRVQH